LWRLDHQSLPTGDVRKHRQGQHRRHLGALSSPRPQ
jgi:hypothetical protein